MIAIQFILLQLASYSFLNWMTFITVAVLFAYFGKGLGIIAGHLVTAVLVATFDVIWIQAIMQQPQWDGTPDQDFAFILGVFVRIILVNMSLTPVSLVAMHTASRRQRHPTKAVAASLPQ